MRLRVAGVPLRIEAPAIVQASLETWIGRFAATAAREGEPCAGEVRLRVDAPGAFVDDHRLDDPAWALRIEEASRSGLVRLAGCATGHYDARACEGVLEGVRHLGAVDAFVRLAVSLALPARGGLLLHACAVEAPGGVAILMGHSGAGKSTAAAAMGANLADELVALHVRGGRLVASGTPWWRGAPGEREVVALCVLERGAGDRRRLRGGEAVRAALPHVARYVVLPDEERLLLSRLAEACARGVVRLRCPEGDAYLPFLARALDGIAGERAEAAA